MRFATQEEAEAYLARYEADRCPCGGSPPWIDPDRQLHSVDWHNKNGWEGLPDVE